VWIALSLLIQPTASDQRAEVLLERLATGAGQVGPLEEGDAE